MTTTDKSAIETIREALESAVKRLTHYDTQIDRELSLLAVKKALAALDAPVRVQAVARIISGYSGDPDSRGSRALKALDIGDLPVGTELYAHQPVKEPS